MLFFVAGLIFHGLVFVAFFPLHGFCLRFCFCGFLFSHLSRLSSSFVFRVLASSLVLFTCSRLCHLAFASRLIVSRTLLLARKLTLSLFIGKGKGRSNTSNSSANAWRDTTSNNGNGDNGSSNGGGSVADDDVDEDGFSAVPRGKRGGKARGGRGGRGGRGKVVVSASERGGNGGTGEKSMLGKMRAFDDDKESVVGSENGWAKEWAE